MLQGKSSWLQWFYCPLLHNRDYGDDDVDVDGDDGDDDDVDANIDDDAGHSLPSWWWSLPAALCGTDTAQ